MAITFEKKEIPIKKYSTWIGVGVVVIILIVVLLNMDMFSSRLISSGFVTPVLPSVSIDYEFLTSDEIKNLEPFVNFPDFNAPYIEGEVKPGRENPFLPPSQAKTTESQASSAATE